MGGSVRMKPLLSKYSGGRAHDFGADAEDGRLARGADPEVAALHEEVDAVLLGSDGVGVGLGDALDDLDVLDVELKSSRRALVGADFAGDDDRGLLGEAFEGFEDCRGHALDVGHALHGAGAVAEDGEQELAALAGVVEPAADGDGLAFVLAQGVYRRERCGRLGGFFGGRRRGGGFFGHEILDFCGVPRPGGARDGAPIFDG